MFKVVKSVVNKTQILEYVWRKYYFSLSTPKLCFFLIVCDIYYQFLSQSISYTNSITLLCFKNNFPVKWCYQIFNVKFKTGENKFHSENASKFTNNQKIV